MAFTRKIESFMCDHCGNNTEGNGYTNHCPKCLWSKHVDIAPGDRLAKCQGAMEPIACRYKKNGYEIYHQCVKCDYLSKNKAAPSDNKELLISLTARPLLS